MSDTEQKLQPCLAEILRTCIKPASMVLQVDGIVTQETTVDSGNRSSAPRSSNTITRFHLTDGELCIQALLQPVLLAHHDPKVGDRIEVRDFVIRKARRLNGSGKIIYLNIQDFAVLNQHNTKDWDGEGGFVKSDQEERSEPSPKRRKRNKPSCVHWTTKFRRRQRQGEAAFYDKEGNSSAFAEGGYGHKRRRRIR